MKNTHSLIFKKIVFSVFALGTIVSCRDSFTNRPDEGSLSTSNYYQNDQQVMDATNALYNRTWFGFSNKFFYALGEVGSGNMYTNSSDVNAMRTFQETSSDAEMNSAWNALWGNVAQANYLINNLKIVAAPGVSPAVINNAIGQAYFIRATAYFYLVRIWGAVPIITNALNNVNSPQLNTNLISDVYQFMTNDYNSAISLLDNRIRTSSYSSNAKVSKGSAESMLAKVYLYQKNYTMARTMAETVINSGEFHLMGGTSVYSIPGKSFADLFTYAGNNSEESIFALQQKGDANYGSANNADTQFGISNGTISTSNASYGGVFGPSQDILTLYDVGDKRRNETIMFPGNVYPNMKILNGLTFQVGFTVPPVDQIGGQNSGAAIKKYCLGVVNSTVTGPVDAYNMMDNNTYIMRYADLLLIEAEAILGGGGSTADPMALKCYNAIRNRAGISEVTSFTFDDLFKERRRELAFEGDYWYDLGRIDRSKAISIMGGQNRGNRFSPEYFTPSNSSFTVPYPANDVAKNPKLLEAPVKYKF